MVASTTLKGQCGCSIEGQQQARMMRSPDNTNEAKFVIHFQILILHVDFVTIQIFHQILYGLYDT